MRRLAVLAALAGLAVLGSGTAASPSLARLTDTETSTGSFGSGILQPPTSLAAAANGSGVVTLTWTPTTSTQATGYDVLRSTTSGSGYGVVSSVTPRTATTTTNTPGNGTFYYVLRSTVQSWTSALSNEASVSVGSTSTGLKGCTTTAADTGGDGNGYQTTPGNACAVDGALAVDASTGTNTVNSCTNAGKDRHRFWGYAFGLPGSVSSINGITVQATLSLNNNGGTSVLCAQLSWDGGTTWTAIQSTGVSGTGLSTYTFGGATDTWGRTWTAANLATGSFRVRLIDVSTQSNKSFRLDGILVGVSYTP
jgi:hypothetical protein